MQTRQTRVGERVQRGVRQLKRVSSHATCLTSRPRERPRERRSARLAWGGENRRVVRVHRWCVGAVGGSSAVAYTKFEVRARLSRPCRASATGYPFLRLTLLHGYAAPRRRSRLSRGRRAPRDRGGSRSAFFAVCSFLRCVSLKTNKAFAPSRTRTWSPPQNISAAPPPSSTPAAC